MAIINGEPSLPPGQRDAADGPGYAFTVGLVGEYLGATSPASSGTVIAWPKGTRLDKIDGKVAVNVARQSYVVGDDVIGGQTRLSGGVDDVLPRVCQGHPIQGMRVP